MRRSTTIISLLVVLAVLFTAAPTVARSKIALGISDPDPDYVTALENHLSRYGTYPRMFSVWSTWGSRGGHAACLPGAGNGSCYFPVEEVDYLMERGITPVIWWQPAHATNFFSKYSKYKKINAGVHDPYIRQWAKELKAASVRHDKRPIIVRFAHEATGAWFPWGIGWQGNTKANYKRAWRHIHQQFVKERARNFARFLWSNFSPRKGAYPGNRYIDYVGFTVLNFGKVKKWRDMRPIVNRAVKASLSFTRKPIIIAEIASFHKGGDKAKWLKQGYLSTYTRHPKVKGMLYLDTKVEQGKNGHPDWRLIKPVDRSAMNAYNALSLNPRFRAGVNWIPKKR